MDSPQAGVVTRPRRHCRAASAAADEPVNYTLIASQRRAERFVMVRAFDAPEVPRQWASPRRGDRRRTDPRLATRGLRHRAGVIQPDTAAGRDRDPLVALRPGRLRPGGISETCR